MIFLIIVATILAYFSYNIYWWFPIAVYPLFFYLNPFKPFLRLNGTYTLPTRRFIFYTSSTIYLIISGYLFDKHIGHWYGWGIGCLIAWLNSGGIASALEPYLFFRAPYNMDDRLEKMANDFAGYIKNGVESPYKMQMKKVCIKMSKKILLIIPATLIAISIFYPTWSITLKGIELSTIRKPLYSTGLEVFGVYAKEHNLKEVQVFPHVAPDFKRMTAEITLICFVTLFTYFLLNKKAPAISQGDSPPASSERADC